MVAQLQLQRRRLRTRIPNQNHIHIRIRIRIRIRIHLHSQTTQKGRHAGEWAGGVRHGAGNVRDDFGESRVGYPKIN